RGRGIDQIAGKSRNRNEVLRVERRDVERADPAIGMTGDMEFVVENLILAQKLLQKLGKDAFAALKKEFAIARGGFNGNIAALLRIGPPGEAHIGVDHIHFLRTAAKGEDARIRLCRIVMIWQDDPIL